MLAVSLPSHSLRSNYDNSLSVPRVMTNTGPRTFHSLEQPPSVCPFSHFSCCLQETPEDTSLWLGLSPIDTGIPDSLLMLQSCFFDLAVEHWFSCRTTEPGFAGDISTIEIWSIYWLMISFWLINSYMSLPERRFSCQNHCVCVGLIFTEDCFCPRCIQKTYGWVHPGS